MVQTAEQQSNQGGSIDPAAVLVVLNARSGTCTVADVRRELRQHYSGSEPRFHEMEEGQDLGTILREAIAAGVRLVVAGGGDGTVSAVASDLVGTGVELALLPLGTANVLALELGIPTDLAAACQLAASRWQSESEADRTSEVRPIDAMRVGDRHYLTQVGVGIDALMIQNTSTEAKRRLGKLAYMMTAIKHIVAFRPHRFTVTVDGARHRLTASEIVVANTGMMGQPSFRWGPDIAADDGRLNVAFIKSARWHDYVRLFWVVFRGHQEKTPQMRHMAFDESITIESRSPLPVQADGEIWGETPVTVGLIARALRVVVPRVG